MTAKTDRFWELTATLGGERPPCEMPLGKEYQICAFGMCGVKATNLCGEPARNVLGAAMTAMDTCWLVSARSRFAATTSQMMRLLFDLLTKDGCGLSLLLFAMADDIETSLPEMIERDIGSVE